MYPVRFGVCAPVFAAPGPAFFRTPALESMSPALAMDVGIATEALGFDSVWVADHLNLGRDGAILEGWTTLSVLAGRTSRVLLGPIHMAQAFRTPALIAKMTSTLDVLSGGRFVFFYDWGGEAESRAYGLPYPSPEDRVAQLDEGIGLVKRLWAADGPVTFSGRYYATVGATCTPAPARRPHPPIWIGESRGDDWCDMVARHADGWNSTPATPARYLEKFAPVDAACRRIGRDPASLERSVELQVLVAPTADDVKARLRVIADLASPPGRHRRREDVLAALESSDEGAFAAAVPDWLIGTPEDVIAQVRAYVAIGVTHFQLWFLDLPSFAGLELFAREVLPAVRDAVPVADPLTEGSR